jgi:hypothetical protein
MLDDSKCFVVAPPQVTDFFNDHDQLIAYIERVAADQPARSDVSAQWEPPNTAPNTTCASMS